MKNRSILLVLILFLFIIPPASATNPTKISISPASKVLVVGDTITLNLTVTPGQEVDTVAIDLLSWNHEVLDCLNVIKGDLFNNPLVWLGGTIDNTHGKITLMVMSTIHPSSAAGLYCTITFKAKASGISTINVNTFGVARNGTDLPKTILNSCQVTVEGSTPVNPPPVNPPPVTPPSNTTNNTTPHTNDTTPVNGTTPPADNTTNSTIPPITPINNETNTTNQGADKNQGNFYDNIPMTIVMYALIIIAVVGAVSYLIVRYKQRQKEQKEDDDFNVDDFLDDHQGGKNDGEADSGSEL